MDNPQTEKHVKLIERILRNTAKTTETIIELNRSMEEILKANKSVKIAADLSTKYRKNVQFNVEELKTKDGAEEAQS